MSSFFDHCVARVRVSSVHPAITARRYYIVCFTLHNGRKYESYYDNWPSAIKLAVDCVEKQKREYLPLFRQDSIVHTFPLAKGGMLDA